MERNSVISSNISKIWYDFESSVLWVIFTNWWEYHYEAVPIEIFEGIMSAWSKWTFFADYVKDLYSYINVN